MARKARSVADVILGEAGGRTPTERLTEMLGIASVIANRAKALGITPEEVVAQDNQFHAYNKALPAGVERYRALAEQALGYVQQNGPVTTAHYFSVTGTPAPAKGLTVAQAGPATTFYDGEFGGVAPTGAPKGLQAVADVTKNPGAWSAMPGANIPGVDSRLTDILSKASTEFAARNPGFSVQGFSGKKGRATGTPNHPAGRAIDVNIIGPDGTALANVRNGDTFGVYQDFANTAKSVQVRDYPELNDDFAWGGYFQQGTAFDQMHFDIGGVRGAFGSWKTGLNSAGKAAMARLGFPDVQNVGWNQNAAPISPPVTPDIQVARAQLPDIARPSFPDLSAISPVTTAVAAEQGVPDLATAASAQEVAERVAPEMAQPFAAPEIASAYGAVERAPAPAIEAISAMDVSPPVTSEQPMFSPPMGALLSVPPSDPQTFSTLREFQKNAIDPTAAVTMSPPSIAEAITPPTEDIFPPAPDEPSNWAKFKTAASPVWSNAMLGNTVAGLPGMAVGAALGLAPQFGFDLDLGPSFDAAVPKEDRFSTGYGLNAISEAMGGPFGATGYSLSNPGMSYVSLGPRTGTGGVGLRRSDKYGWTEVVGPNGEVRGIKYDDPNKGGIFGSLSRALSGAFGHGFTDKERSYADTHAGLF